MQTLTELHRSWRLGSWLPYACYLLCKILIVFFCPEKDHFYHSSISWNGPYWTHNAESDTRITCAVDPVKSGRRPLTRHPGADEPRTFCRPKRRPGTQPGRWLSLFCLFCLVFLLWHKQTCGLCLNHREDQPVIPSRLQLYTFLFHSRNHWHTQA